MISKILCPTDFSSSSTNAIEYAARLAQKMNASLTLFHVQQVSMGEGVSLVSGGERESVHEAKKASAQMEDICQNIRKVFNVSCSHKIASSSLGSFEKAIANESGQFDLTIIGTNGADNLGQLYFGSHSFRVAKKESGPVIIVPEECDYREIINLAFASDIVMGEKLSLQQLKHFTDTFNPQLRVAYIAEMDDATTKDAYLSFCNLTEEALNYDQRITFEMIIQKDEAEAIENFVKKTQADLLALYMEKHGILYKMFHENIIKELTSGNRFPILIFHQ